MRFSRYLRAIPMGTHGISWYLMGVQGTPHGKSHGLSRNITVYLGLQKSTREVPRVPVGFRGILRHSVGYRGQRKKKPNISRKLPAQEFPWYYRGNHHPLVLHLKYHGISHGNPRDSTVDIYIYIYMVLEHSAFISNTSRMLRCSS